MVVSGSSESGVLIYVGCRSGDIADKPLLEFLDILSCATPSLKSHPPYPRMDVTRRIVNNRNFKLWGGGALRGTETRIDTYRYQATQFVNMGFPSTR